MDNQNFRVLLGTLRSKALRLLIELQRSALFTQRLMSHCKIEHWQSALGRERVSLLERRNSQFEVVLRVVKHSEKELSLFSTGIGSNSRNQTTPGNVRTMRKC